MAKHSRKLNQIHHHETIVRWTANFRAAFTSMWCEMCNWRLLVIIKWRPSLMPAPNLNLTVGQLEFNFQPSWAENAARIEMMMSSRFSTIAWRPFCDWNKQATAQSYAESWARRADDQVHCFPLIFNLMPAWPKTPRARKELKVIHPETHCS